MGFLDDLADGFRKFTGGVDQDLLATGILARGEVLGISMSGTTVTIMNGPVERNCTFRLRVMRDGAQPYEATVVQRVQEIMISALQQPGVVLALKVDPADPQRVAIDFGSAPPEVTLPETSGTDSAAYVLEHGKPITVVLVGNQRIGIKNHKGDPVHALELTVATGVPEPYQTTVGNAVPAFALPLLYPGSKLHAKLGDGPSDIVVDWAAGPVT